jgi:hypothetical protein
MLIKKQAKIGLEIYFHKKGKSKTTFKLIVDFGI